MRLRKWPDLETEYWEAIEATGQYIFSTSRALSRGQITDTKSTVARSITQARRISERLSVELCRKFSVIHPNDCPTVELGKSPPLPPVGKEFYWDWYRRMKVAKYSKEYEGMICSACPFSNGLPEMVTTGATPCDIFPGRIFALWPPFECAMLQEWSRKKLYAEIAGKAGRETLARFQKRRRSLRRQFLRN